ncbi:type II toxin-antitoxin system HicB family antitoxin [Herbaspirillum sp. LeCh32-8]|uniref:type II toxin-antitoxin system HicB family antitoxin n=1 Tax=Herbaspirillum sp. LeCh32-8 TaxID=2821356 RepID=UPI001AE2D462|nr:type II toxin-antitoxin system HicB family antitoxin [Herbaspirillum sp. LeCh32-8]MBP0597948.1 type II toxin-antitoxin system HicB family antitoxin [Herbaspirillum sp. LeCh32-8]
MEILLVIQKDEGSTYGVTVPSIKGCFSWGDTIEEAVKNAREAIEAHIETSLETGSEVNVDPLSLDEVQEEFPNDRYVFVEIDDKRIDKTPERINVSLPRFVLSKIDSHVDDRHETRSGFLVRAALRQLDHDEKERTDEHAHA